MVIPVKSSGFNHRALQETLVNALRISLIFLYQQFVRTALRYMVNTVTVMPVFYIAAFFHFFNNDFFFRNSQCQY